ncbi:centrosomal protein of 126 kDa [Erpetoichthys calabaricus]|uniref:Centrosomal protein of 126 kDa n=1 Tax=Erpetoichthys calabaricus TaxID=27687 RepID=A0A8C4S8C2_ERPCA|nr:centrosomal protein of 126 kDa [Erpetoichthys calabaricus]
MQVPRASSYSNLKTQFEKELEDERQSLLEDQKASRAKVRNFSQETNRRRRALEEKRKEEDVREQKLRENILLQRKQKLQEVTEKFQRAHLPSSQRKRQGVFRRQSPHLDDALKQIQSSFSPVSYQSTILSRNSGSSKSPSPSFSSISNVSGYQKHLPATVTYAKLMQEKSGINLRNSQLLFQQELEEAQRLLEEQKMSSLQEFQKEVRQLAKSESLSSLDSLENEEDNQTSLSDSRYSSNTSVNTSLSYISIPQQTPRKYLGSFSTPAEKTFLRNDQQNIFVNEHWSQDTSSFSQGHVYFKASKDQIKCLSDKEQATMDKTDLEKHADKQYFSSISNSSSSEPNVLSPKRHQSVLPYYKEARLTTAVQDMFKKERDLANGGLSNTPPTKAWATPDPTPRDVPILPQEQPELGQPVRKPSGYYSVQPKATPLILQSGQPTGEVYSVQSSATSCSLPGNTVQYKMDLVGTPENPSDIVGPNHHSKNDLSTVYPAKISDNKSTYYEFKNKSNNDTDTTNNTCKLGHAAKISFSEVTAATQPAEPKKTDSSFITSHNLGNTCEAENGTKKLKGILKKNKNVSTSKPTPDTVILGKQGTITIRDSVELTKLKEKKSEGSKTKKKLRWFDEIEESIVEERETGADQKEIKNKLLEQISEADNFRSANEDTVRSMTDAPEKSVKMDTTEEVAAHTTAQVSSTGYHFAKQAWIDSKVQDNKLPENTVVPKSEKATPVRKGKQKFSRRARSARAHLGAATSKTRKGTTIRPRSAGEINSVIKSQGTIIVPHPPPKPPPSDGQQVQSVSSNRQTISNPPKIFYNDISATSKESIQLGPQIYKDITDGCALPQGIPFTNSAVTFTPYPPSHPVSSQEAKTTLTVSAAQSATQNIMGSSIRTAVFGENGMRLERTPTDEEITLLWQDVRTALAPKEAGESRNFASCNGSVSSPPRATLSHVTIDGGSLMSGVKSVSGVGGIYSPVMNGSANINVNKRKPIAEGYGTKHRTLLEQRKQATGSATRKPALTGQGSIQTLQIIPFPSANDPAQPMHSVSPEKVSESTAQFLLAENLADTSVADEDILAAMETIQSQKYAFLRHRALHLGLGSLSMEEQKLLHSLDRLNQRLQHVQEAVGGNPSAASVLQIAAPLSAGQSGLSGAGEAAVPYKNFVTGSDSCPPIQKR